MTTSPLIAFGSDVLLSCAEKLKLMVRDSPLCWAAIQVLLFVDYAPDAAPTAHSRALMASLIPPFQGSIL